MGRVSRRLAVAVAALGVMSFVVFQVSLDGSVRSLSNLTAEEVLLEHLGALRDHDAMQALATVASDRRSLSMVLKWGAEPDVLDVVAVPGSSMTRCEYEVLLASPFPGAYETGNGEYTCRFILSRDSADDCWQVADWGV